MSFFLKMWWISIFWWHFGVSGILLTFFDSVILVTLFDVSDRIQMENAFGDKMITLVENMLGTPSNILMSDVGDSFKIWLTESWIMVHDVDDFFNVKNWSPTSQTCHQHICQIIIIILRRKIGLSLKVTTDSFILSSSIKFEVLKVLKYQLWCLAIVIS